MAREPAPQAAVGRRALMGAALALPGAMLWPRAARAGGQLEEPLADAVRSALSAAIANDAPPVPSFASTEARLAYLRWLSHMSDRLYSRQKDFDTRIGFLQTLWYEARRAGLDPSLVLGLVQVESAFRKYAVSKVGARGYMQVMPFWLKVMNRPDDNLFHLRTNLRYGCTILRHYLDIEKGDLYRALGRYNGSLGKPEYPNMVNAAWQKQWHYGAGGG